MRFKIYLLIALIVMSLQTGCMYIVRYDGTYSGKVVDTETREPIEGAVVLGTWSIESPTIAGAHNDYYDARETTTDKNGEFSIPGQGLRIMSRLLPMSVMIFKAGYQYIGPLGWDSLKISDYYQERVKWEGEKPILPLNKLTMEERKRQIVPSPPDNAPFEKVKLMLREIDKERVERGLDARGLWRGTKYE